MGFTYFTGGFGTILQEKGLKPGELPETWNIIKPEMVTGVHKDYINIGSKVVETNTFGANIIKYPEGSKYSLEEIISSAIANVRSVIGTDKNVLVALDIGPTGKMLEPLGELKFEEAVKIFAQTIKLGVKYGVDLILIETMADLYEAKAAIVAAKENSDLPIWVTCVFNENSRMLTGADPFAMVTLLEGLGVDALGLNCSLSPDKMLKTVEQIKKYASIPVIVCPNAGLPIFKDGKTSFESTPEEFANGMKEIAKTGVDILGGCCGTTPEHIKQMIELVKELEPVKPLEKTEKTASSIKGAIIIDENTVIESIENTDLDSILDDAYDVIESADVLELCLTFADQRDYNKELELMEEVLKEFQGVVSIPILFKTEYSEVLEYALRNYNGKAMYSLTEGLSNEIQKTNEIINMYGALKSSFEF